MWNCTRSVGTTLALQNYDFLLYLWLYYLHLAKQRTANASVTKAWSKNIPKGFLARSLLFLPNPQFKNPDKTPHPSVNRSYFILQMQKDIKSEYFSRMTVSNHTYCQNAGVDIKQHAKCLNAVTFFHTYWSNAFCGLVY